MAQIRVSITVFRKNEKFPCRKNIRVMKTFNTKDEEVDIAHEIDRIIAKMMFRPDLAQDLDDYLSKLIEMRGA